MKNDKYGGGKRTNWLLIKHHDEYAHDGDHDALLEEDRSVASGRPMEDIAAGKGRTAQAVHAREAGKRSHADAVWHSKGASRETKPAAPKAAAKKKRASGKKAAKLPDFVAPQLCEARRTSAVRQRLGPRDQVRRLSRSDCASRTAKPCSKTRKGLDWTEQFPAIAKAAQALPDCIIDGEIVALDEDGAPNFAALQAALSDGKTDSLIYFAFDLLFATAARIYARCRFRSAKRG